MIYPRSINKVIPYLAGEKIEGFKITQTAEDSILSMNGIQPNDIYMALS